MKKQVGDRVTARDREGNIIWQPTIRGIARLHSPTPDGYEPVVMLVEHDNGNKELYFPYWKVAGGKQQFTNRAPMFDEGVWLELLTDAIRQGFFTRDFLKRLTFKCVDALAEVV